MRSIQQKNGILPAVAGLNESSFLSRHFRRGTRKPSSHADQGALHLRLDATHCAWTGLGLFLTQTLAKVQPLFENANQRKESTDEDQESDCYRDLKRFKKAPLDLYLDDAADDDIADDLENHGDPQSEVPARVCEHWSEVFGLKDLQTNESDDRNRGQHVHREAAFRRVNAYLPAQFESLSHNLGHRVENLTEVTARLSLYLKR